MRKLLFILSSSALLGCCVAGCGSKEEQPTGSLEDNVRAVEQADAASAEPSPTAGQSQQPQPSQELNQAVTAYKSGNYEAALARLRSLRAAGARTPEQALAIQDATAAVMAELYELAAQGDPRAKKALEEHQQFQNRRR